MLATSKNIKLTSMQTINALTTGLVWQKNGPRRDQYPSPEIQTKTTNAAPDKQAQAARKKQLYIQTKNKAKLKTG